MHTGNYIFVLHAHLPWALHHGDWPHGVDWVSEAVAECYVPLLNVFSDLMEEGVPPKVSIDVSPVLCEQLEHPDFKEIFVNYCDAKIAAAIEDEKKFTDWGYDPHHIYMAGWWRQWYEDRKHDFVHKYDKSVVGGLRKLQDAGAIEVMTCGATHGYLPLLGSDKSVNMQIETAVENYKKHFGRDPRGIWLPECAYRPSYEWKSLLPIAPFNKPRFRPGIEQFLARYDLEFFFVDQSLTERAGEIGTFLNPNKENFVHVMSPSFKSKPWNFLRNPMNLFQVASSDKTEYGTAAAFTRHREIAMQVWSGEVGYPGEPDYLDFHKKQYGSMLRYWRVTDSKTDMMYKTLYHPDWTRDKIDKQSNHFIHHIENSTNYYNRTIGKFATLCAPFDAELFGHWWFEGPEFIRAVVKGLSHSPYVNSATASEQFYKIQPVEVMYLPEGSWGVDNNHDVWSNDQTLWTWEAIYNDELRFMKLMDKYPAEIQKGDLRRVSLQAMRELLLLQASDWQFLIYTQSAKDYAEMRFSYHHSDFNKLCDLAEKVAETKKLDDADEKYLRETELRNSPFRELDLAWWRE